MTKLLDTNIVLYHLGGKLTEPLASENYFISIISEMELLSYPLLNPDAESKIKAFLSELTLVDLGTDIKEKAIEFRRKLSLKLPDAIIAATAFILNIELLSNDQKFSQIPNLRCKKLSLSK